MVTVDDVNVDDDVNVNDDVNVDGKSDLILRTPLSGVVKVATYIGVSGLGS